MELTETRSGDFLILEPVGQLDTRSSNGFEKAVVGYLAGGDRRFIIDLVSTEYISSAGLRVLLMLAKKLDSGGGEGELILCSLNASVREVFDIAGFTGVFTIAQSREGALASSAKKPRAAKVFNLAARLLAIKKFGDDEPVKLDPLTSRLSRRAAELLAIAEARDLAKG